MSVFETKKKAAWFWFERLLDSFECQVNNKQENTCLLFI